MSHVTEGYLPTRQYEAQQPVEVLTDADHALMRMIADGETRKEIAVAFDTTCGAVTHWAFRVYRKLGARNAANAVALWLGR